MPVVTIRPSQVYYPRPGEPSYFGRCQFTVDLLEAMPGIVVAAMGEVGVLIKHRDVLVNIAPPYHSLAINAPGIGIVVAPMWSALLEENKERLLVALTEGVGKRISQLPDHLRPVVDIEVLFAHGCGLTLAGGVTARWGSGPMPT